MPYRVDYKQAESLDNWFVHLGLECTDFDSRSSLFNVSFASGIILGLILFPRLADGSGRKRVFYMGVFLHAIIVGTTFITDDVGLFYGLVFLMGVEQVARFLVGYLYLSEFCLE